MEIRIHSRKQSIRIPRISAFIHLVISNPMLCCSWQSQDHLQGILTSAGSLAAGLQRTMSVADKVHVPEEFKTMGWGGTFRNTGHHVYIVLQVSLLASTFIWLYFKGLSSAGDYPLQIQGHASQSAPIQNCRTPPRYWSLAFSYLVQRLGSGMTINSATRLELGSPPLADLEGRWCAGTNKYRIGNPLRAPLVRLETNFLSPVWTHIQLNHGLSPNEHRL